MSIAQRMIHRGLRRFSRDLQGARRLLGAGYGPKDGPPVADAGPLRPRALAGVLLLVSVLLLMGATGDSSGQRFDRLGHNLMCMCGCNQVLLECNHVGCTTSEQMRQELKLAIDRGDSDKVILAGFVAKYGPTVLSAPTTTGFNRVAWIMPPIIFVAGLTAVILIVRRWKRRTPTPPSSAAGLDSGALDEFRRRAREETSL